MSQVRTLNAEPTTKLYIYIPVFKLQVLDLHVNFPILLQRIHYLFSYLFDSPGCTFRMALPSHRELEFVGVTIQDGGHLQLDSLYNNTGDAWHVKVACLILMTLLAGIYRHGLINPLKLI